MGQSEPTSTLSTPERKVLRVLLRGGRGLGTIALGLLVVWSVLAIYFSNLPSAGLRGTLATLYAAGALAAALFLRERIPIRRWLLVSTLPIFLWWITISPSNDRDWSPDQVLLSSAEIQGDRIKLRNIRNFVYRTVDDYTPRHYDSTFDLKDLESVDFVVEHFSGTLGAAHTLLTFGFKGGAYVAISIEIRKEQGEQFSPLKGLFKQYELMYVIGDERDLIALRAYHRKDDVYLYPIRASRQKMQELFLDMIERANGLVERPEFYNTLLSSCTTNIVAHINRVSPSLIPISLKVLLPAYSDRLAYDLGLIDTDLSYSQIRERFKINRLCAEHMESPDFSLRIREGLCARPAKVNNTAK